MNFLEEVFYFVASLLAIALPVWLIVSICKFAYWFSEQLFKFLS